MKIPKVTRRRFLLSALLLTPGAVVAEATLVEPDWIKVSRLKLTDGKPAHRFVHFTDLHHKGDRAHLQSLVDLINAQSPDFVCFTGDLIEDGEHLPEVLELLSGIKCPLYGVPGNHDYWSKVPFDDIIKCFSATGGAWLLNEQRLVADGRVNLIGLARIGPLHPIPVPSPGVQNILLIHYPAWAKILGGHKFDLMLAGHSHGGQVRIPFYGAIVVPFGVEEYEAGLFQTDAGPLYVGSGIGWFFTPIRFNCRPEITVIEI